MKHVLALLMVLVGLPAFAADKALLSEINRVNEIFEDRLRLEVGELGYDSNLSQALNLDNIAMTVQNSYNKQGIKPAPAASTLISIMVKDETCWQKRKLAVTPLCIAKAILKDRQNAK